MPIASEMRSDSEWDRRHVNGPGDLVMSQEKDCPSWTGGVAATVRKMPRSHIDVADGVVVQRNLLIV
jgi:hypothetical protein